jgi:hypothetical protein
MKQIGMFDSVQRDEFFKSLRKGEKGDCPCCLRHAQIYKRHLHFVTAWQLIRLYKMGGYGEYVNASELIYDAQHGTGDFSKMKYWGLIERRPLDGSETTKKSSGWWRLTDKGASFVLGKTTIKKFALIFDDEIIGFEGDDIDIRYALNQKFDYERLMTA